MITALWQEGVVSISAGISFSAAATLAGRVWTWGRNKYGQLGDGSFENGLHPRPVQGVERAVQAGIQTNPDRALQSPRYSSWVSTAIL